MPRPALRTPVRVLTLAQLQQLVKDTRYTRKLGAVQEDASDTAEGGGGDGGGVGEATSTAPPPDLLICDVRNSFVAKRSRIKGAVHIPPALLLSRAYTPIEVIESAIDDKRFTKDGRRGKHVVVYDAVGGGLESGGETRGTMLATDDRAPLVTIADALLLSLAVEGACSAVSLLSGGFKGVEAGAPDLVHTLSASYTYTEGSPSYLFAEELATLMREGEGERLIVVDVRDYDVVGGMIKGAINVPSAEFDDKAMADIVAKYGDRDRIIFHCMHSAARGPYCARATAAYVLSKHPGLNAEVNVLKGGFLGWARKYGRDESMTEGFDEEIWGPQMRGGWGSA